MLNFTANEVMSLMEIKSKQFLKQEVVESVELSNFIPGIFLVYPEGDFPKMEDVTVRYLVENTDDATWNIIEPVMKRSRVFYDVFIENTNTNKKIADRASDASLMSVVSFINSDDDIDPQIATDLFKKFFDQDFREVYPEIQNHSVETIKNDVAEKAIRFSKKHNLSVNNYLYYLAYLSPAVLKVLSDEELVLLSKRFGFADHQYMKDALAERNL